MPTKKNLPFLLVILDGLANNPSDRSNAVENADTPVLDRLRATCPKTELVTWGPRVGLPEGQMGNSEVGHLNIGGGRIVKQELTRIDEVAENRAFSEIPTLRKLFNDVSQSKDAALHLIGLASTGGVHSSLKHILELVRSALEAGVSRLYIHAITDGRDRPMNASLQDIGRLQEFLQTDCRVYRDRAEFGIASLIGRYFAMDRDNRRERTVKALRLYTKGEGKPFTDPLGALKEELDAGKTDEFHEPMFASRETFKRAPVIQSGDGVLFCNFRADRMRQIVSCFLPVEKGGLDGVPEITELRPSPLSIATLTDYDSDFKVPNLFPPHFVKNHLGEVLSNAGLTQLRIAETEKYPHVTYFFNGAVEEPYRGEDRLIIPSPRDVPTYDHKPEMSAYEVTEAFLKRLESDPPDVTILNFANCDMVGHTGNYAAAKKAVETVDECLGRLLAAVESKGGTAIVTADHGNADQMVDYVTGEPHTFHTMYPVPLFLVGKALSNCTLRSGGALCDVSPTICEIIGVEEPGEMTGVSLIQKGTR